jgi:DNA (cytosine-5)-methyltransferase 1
VAQRRRRVFVVGYLGDWRLAAAILFERHSLQGHPAPSREKRQGAAASAGAGASVGSLCARTGQSISVQDAAQGHLMPIKQWPADISSTLDTTFGTKQGLENQHINAGCPMFVPSYGIPGNWIGRKPENGGNATEPMYDIAPCLTKADQHGVAQPIAFSGQMSNPQTDVDMTQTLQAKNPMAVMQPIGFDAYNNDVIGDVSKTIDTGQDYHHVPNILQHMAVRRLTPKECERLQGFPDNYTDIQPKGKPTPDGPRYKALGNSMAVPVMAWIGQRIEQVEAICKQNK